MTEAAKNFCVDAITRNDNLSERMIVYLFSESELETIVNKRTIARTLNNLGYKYKNLNFNLRIMINKKWHV